MTGRAKALHYVLARSWIASFRLAITSILSLRGTQSAVAISVGPTEGIREFASSLALLAMTKPRVLPLRLAGMGVVESGKSVLYCDDSCGRQCLR